MENDPHELKLSLQYPDGWREIFGAPDAADYAMWLDEMVHLAADRLGTDPSEDLKRKWQAAIELIAEAAIDPEEFAGLTQAEIIETALLSLQTNIENIGWDEEGIAFTVPNLHTGEDVSIDLRNLPVVDN